MHSWRVEWVVVEEEEEGECEAWEGHMEAALVVRGVGWRMLLRLIESDCGAGG